jgi:thioredoxin-related protein
MNEAAMVGVRKYFAVIAAFGAMLIIFTASGAQAAELVMFERAGCEWCAAFDRDIAPIYVKSEEGLRAPLRRVDVMQPLPPDLAFIEVERFTPLFVLVDHGREIGRIRGYPGPDSFWMQLSVLFDRLPRFGTGGERAQLTEKTLRAGG